MLYFWGYKMIVKIVKKRLSQILLDKLYQVQISLKKHHVFFNFCFESLSFLWRAVWLRQAYCVTAEVRRGLDKTSSCSSYGSSAGSDDLSDPTDYKYSRTRTRPIPILKSQFRPEISPLAREDPLARLREAIGIVWLNVGVSGRWIRKTFLSFNFSILVVMLEVLLSEWSDSQMEVDVISFLSLFFFNS